MYSRDGEKLHCTHRQRLMYGVDLNVLAERHAALHSKAMRLQARAVDAAPRIDASNVMKTTGDTLNTLSHLL